MSWKQINSKKPEYIQIAFDKWIFNATRRYILVIDIHQIYAKEIEFKEGDYISFLYDDKNPRNWLIKKTNDISLGVKLTKKTKGLMYFEGGKIEVWGCDSHFLTISKEWDSTIFIPTKSDFDPRFVKYEIKDEGIIIYADIPNSLLSQ